MSAWSIDIWLFDQIKCTKEFTRADGHVGPTAWLCSDFERYARCDIFKDAMASLIWVHQRTVRRRQATLLVVEKRSGVSSYKWRILEAEPLCEAPASGAKTFRDLGNLVTTSRPWTEKRSTGERSARECWNLSLASPTRLVLDLHLVQVSRVHENFLTKIDALPKAES